MYLRTSTALTWIWMPIFAIWPAQASHCWTPKGGQLKYVLKPFGTFDCANSAFALARLNGYVFSDLIKAFTCAGDAIDSNWMGVIFVKSGASPPPAAASSARLVAY